MHINKDKKLCIISNEDRQNFNPDIEVLKDAVVTPWYRNQEQPQVISSISVLIVNLFKCIFFFFSIFMWQRYAPILILKRLFLVQ